MLKTARQEALLRFLKVDTFTPVDVLAQQLTVSPATTRRDLLELETQGLIERT
ncbi:MAG: DeoR family transcriptional regulator, partial [Actinomycetales bacterium]